MSEIADYSYTWNCTCNCSPADPPRNWPKIVILFFIVLFGILANGALIFIIVKNKLFRKMQNILFVNLMVGDLLCLLIRGSLTLELSISQFQTKLTGNFLCKVTNSYIIITSCLVVYSLVALSIERYQKIKDPFHRCEESCWFIYICHVCDICARNPNVLIVAIIWICSTIVSAPIIVWAEDRNGSCFYINHHTTKAKIYKIFLLMATYIIPFIIIATVHIIMVCVLLKSIRDPIVRNSERLSCSGKGNHLRQRGSRTRSRMKLAVVVSVLSVFFFIAQLPSSIFNMMFEFADWCIVSSPEFLQLYEWATVPFPLLCSLNPVIMFILSSSFRRQLRCECCGPSLFRRISLSSQRNTELVQIEMH